MNRRELPHTIQLFSLHSLSEAAENSPTPLVDFIQITSHCKEGTGRPCKALLPKPQSPNSPSLKHTYTHKERDRQTPNRDRQGPDREIEKETEMKKLRKTYPKLLTLKHVFTEELPFFPLNFISLYQPHIKTKKPRL